MSVLRDANCLTTLDLQAGQLLRVPPNTIGGTGNPAGYEGCTDPAIKINRPKAGDNLRSGFEAVGLADTPDFGFYRLQVKHAGGAPDYHTVYESTNRVSSERGLGIVNFQSNYITGTYWLRVAVYNSEAELVGYCAVRVNFVVP
jgi:hypothetical protein